MPFRWCNFLICTQLSGVWAVCLEESRVAARAVWQTSVSRPLCLLVQFQSGPVSGKEPVFERRNWVQAQGRGSGSPVLMENCVPNKILHLIAKKEYGRTFHRRSQGVQCLEPLLFLLQALFSSCSKT